MSDKRYTKADIISILNDDTIINHDVFGRISRGDLAAMRAVCRLYASQCADEKRTESTRHDNNIGFMHGHAKMGSALGAFMDEGKKDGVMRRVTRGIVNKWVHMGKDANGKSRYAKFSSKFVGRDRVEVCHYLANFYAQQLADFANGDKRGAVATVAHS